MRKPRAYHYRRACVRTLRQVQVVDALAGVGVERRDASMLHKANDGVGILAAKLEVLAKWILVWEILLCERFVDDDHLLRRRTILGRKFAAANHRNSHGAEIIRGHCANDGVRAGIAGTGGTSFDLERA